jgi:fucose 4-O-acetylase-like acetyltransferase
VLVGPVSTFLYHFHMPMFFMLSGLVFKPKAFSGWLHSRLQTLAVPYIAWMAVAVCVSVLVQTAGLPSGGRPGLRYMLYGGAALKGLFATFWFVTCLFATLLIYNLIRNSFGGPLNAKVIAAVAVCAAAGGVIARHSLPEALNMAPIAVALLWAGDAYRTVFKNRQPNAIAIALVAIVAVVGLLFGRPLDMKYGNLGTPILSVVSGVAISVLLFTAARAYAATGPVPRFVHHLAAGSLVIMFAHPLVYVPLRGTMPDWALLIVALGTAWSAYMVILRAGRWPRRIFVGENI